MSSLLKYKKSLYKKTFYRRLKNILTTPEKFKKMSKEERALISSKLKELSLFADSTSVLKEDFGTTVSEFEIERLDFKELISNELARPIRRKDSGILVNQIKIMIETILDFCYNNGFLVERVESENILAKLDSDKIFFIITLSLLSSIKYVQSNDAEHRFEVNQIDRHVFQKKLLKNFILHLIVLILEENRNNFTTLSDLYSNIPNIIHSSSSKTNQCFIKAPLQLIWLFCEVFKMSATTVNYKSNNSHKSITLIDIPEKLLEFNIPPTHIPEIIPPAVEYNQVSDLINFSKKIKDGISNVRMSNETKKAMKISQIKNFEINQTAINLFEKLDQAPYEIVKNVDLLPFTPINYLVHLEEKIKEYTNKLGEKLIQEISNFYYQRNDFVQNMEEKIKKELNINYEQISLSKELYLLKKDYKKRMRLRILHNTIIEFAKIFIGYPIYFTNSYDYRIRMYPWSFMFSRTSGVYKYLLIEKVSEIRRDGLLTMIKAYYKDRFSVEYTKIYDMKFIVKKFIADNPNLNECEVTDKSSFYRVLLGLEIIQLPEKDFKSGYMLEIDQKSSASVILSILMGDKILAEQTNLISKNENKDVNKFIMNKSKEWFEGKITPESLEIMSNNRKFHKYLFMCFIYNETFFGRFKRISNFLTTDQDILIIAKEYPEFINSVFPSVYKKKQLFNSIVKFYLVKTNKGVELETLDGSIVSWFVYKKIHDANTRIKVTHPLTKERVSVSHSPLDINNINVKKILAGMLPHLIHSIDGSLMRKIIIEVYENKKYIINHLHDSIQFSPNNHELILKSIEKVYKDEKIKKILKDGFFKRLENNLLPEDKKEFKRLVDEFFSYEYHDLLITEETLNINGMFPFE